MIECIIMDKDTFFKVGKRVERERERERERELGWLNEKKSKMKYI